MNISKLGMFNSLKKAIPTAKRAVSVSVNYLNKGISIAKPKKASIFKVLALAVVANVPSSVGPVLKQTEKISSNVVKESLVNLSKSSTINEKTAIFKNEIDTLKNTVKTVSQKIVKKEKNHIKPELNLSEADTFKIQPAVMKFDTISSDSIVLNAPVKLQADSSIIDTSKILVQTKDTALVDTAKIEQNVNDSITAHQDDIKSFKEYFDVPERQESLEKLEEKVAKHYIKKGEIISFADVSTIKFGGDQTGKVPFHLINMVEENYNKTGNVINPEVLSERKLNLYKQIKSNVAEKNISNNCDNKAIKELAVKIGAEKQEFYFVKLALKEITKENKASLAIDKLYSNQVNK